MSENNGYSLGKAPNGAESKLFKDFLDNFNGNRVEAIKAKAKIYSDSFKKWFGDWEKGLHIVQDNNLYYRGQYEEPIIDKDGNLILKGKQDQLYKDAGYDIDKGVSATTDMGLAIDYGSNQRYAYESDIEDKYGEMDQSWEKQHELEEILEHGYYLIQFPKSVSNQVIKEGEEVKLIGDVVIPKGSYTIEHITEDGTNVVAVANSNASKVVNVNNITSNINKVDKSLVDVIPYDKPWKSNPSKINKTLRIYLKDHSKGYFELVKDEEYGIYSVHFKTKKEGAKYNGDWETSTKEDRKILFKELVKLIPEGAQVSTWGELSDEGIIGLNNVGRDMTKIGERVVSSKVTGGEITIPVYQKGDGISKVVDENGEPTVDAVTEYDLEKPIYEERKENKIEVKSATVFQPVNMLSLKLATLFPHINVLYNQDTNKIDINSLEDVTIFLTDDREVDADAHEYAHYYLHMFKDHPLVMAAIKLYGSMESLTKAVGEQATE